MRRTPSAAAVLVAGLLDLTVGEPPVCAHPVVWMGRYLTAAARVVPSGPPTAAARAGGAAWAVGATATAACGYALERWARRSPHLWPVPVVAGATLSTLLSARLLVREVRAVESAVAGDITEARQVLGRIVSRETATLTEGEVREAALESLAENLADSVVAPLFWYAVGGLPAACLYRFANTADAMWGYRTARWQHAGRVAARVDDLMNLLPARLTAFALLGSVRPRRLAQLRREAGRTSSPNAGWPMAALALRLDVRLGKRDAYLLNPQGRPPCGHDTRAALRIAARAGTTAFFAAAAVTRLRRRSDQGTPTPREPGAS